MSPFRVDHAGDIIDSDKRSSVEGTDAPDLVLEHAVSTESETEQEDLVEAPIKTFSSCSNDHTMLTEVDSLTSSINSSPADEDTKQEPPTQLVKETSLPTKTKDDKKEVPSSTHSRNSRVSFSQIQIREYPIIVGDNPSVLTGTPITIDWDHVEQMEFHVDEYESGRAEPRTMVELRMPASARDALLKNQGFSLGERNAGKKVANITKNQRKRTSETMGLSKAAEKVETWTRATRNATWGRRKKQQERNYLQQFESDRSLTLDCTRSSVGSGKSFASLEKGSKESEYTI